MFAQQNGNWSQVREFAVRGLVRRRQPTPRPDWLCVQLRPVRTFKLTVNDTGNALLAISGQHNPECSALTSGIGSTSTNTSTETPSGAERAQSS